MNNYFKNSSRNYKFKRRKRRVRLRLLFIPFAVTACAVLLIIFGNSLLNKADRLLREAPPFDFDGGIPGMTRTPRPVEFKAASITPHDSSNTVRFETRAVELAASGYSAASVVLRRGDGILLYDSKVPLPSVSPDEGIADDLVNTSDGGAVNAADNNSNNEINPNKADSADSADNVDLIDLNKLYAAVSTAKITLSGCFATTVFSQETQNGQYSKISYSKAVTYESALIREITGYGFDDVIIFGLPFDMVTGEPITDGAAPQSGDSGDDRYLGSQDIGNPSGSNGVINNEGNFFSGSRIFDEIIVYFEQIRRVAMGADPGLITGVDKLIGSNTGGDENDDSESGISSADRLIGAVSAKIKIGAVIPAGFFTRSEAAVYISKLAFAVDFIAADFSGAEFKGENAAAAIRAVLDTGGEYFSGHGIRVLLPALDGAVLESVIGVLDEYLIRNWQIIE